MLALVPFQAGSAAIGTATAATGAMHKFPCSVVRRMRSVTPSLLRYSPDAPRWWGGDGAHMTISVFKLTQGPVRHLITVIR